mmetsp:Transcript_27933/g.33935  ORF Transcript_27933/g.33935 Transcript_27933/m.33935 type:complete len:85 (-) Transcript_27933:555-809(-)
MRSAPRGGGLDTLVERLVGDSGERGEEPVFCGESGGVLANNAEVDEGDNGDTVVLLLGPDKGRPVLASSSSPCTSFWDSTREIH